MSNERILIVDDEKNIASSLEGILSDEGYQISVAGDGLDALEKIQSDPPDLVLLDIWLPGMDGIEVLKTLKSYHPEIEVLIMSGHGTIDTAVKATKLGAYDFIEKPFSMDHLTQSVENVLRIQKTLPQNQDERFLKKLELLLCLDVMVGVKKAIKTTAKKNKPVLLLGEKGTGKELIAQAIHRQSSKRDRPFLKLKCAVRQMQDIQSELFAKGKRTAKNMGDRRGRPYRKIEKAVLLSNIDALSKGLQEKLVQALTQKSSKKQDPAQEFLPIRLFASSSKDLNAMANKGQFNEALLELFKDCTLNVPPLREFSANIPVLVKDYFEENSQRDETSSFAVDRDCMEALCRYNWPGNLKELRSVLDQLLITGPSRGKITLQDLPPELRQDAIQLKTNDLDDFDSLKEAEIIWEKEFLLQHLKKNGWNLDKTSKDLKTSNERLKEKLKRHSILLPDTLGKSGDPLHHLQRTLKRSVVLCGSGLHSGIKTGLILQPLPAGSGIIFGDISTGQTIPARLENITSTEYSTCLKKGRVSVATIEHIMAVLHMYRITNLLIKVGDEAPVMDGSAKDFCKLIEDGEFEDQEEFYDEIVIDKTYTFGSQEKGGTHITVEPADKFTVSYHMEYPEPIGVQDFTYEFDGETGFKKEIAPARTFGFLKDVAQLTKMGFASGGKLDNFILLGDNKVLNTQLRFKDEFARHKILDILGDFYLLGKPLRCKITAHKSGHTQNIGVLKKIQRNFFHSLIPD
ncbi:MAG: UDP-3-O-acyl-N-acetylglucosamine deacetylase [Nitrospinota bacterium]|nr:UDP-3-O-acyl-N-acetylglucosamine deacetylase [Nitrospinota bacterium]